jgi:glycosyltransferase involved in cell wall biosynthesis
MENVMHKQILITGPFLNDPGGVANYYNAVLPHLRSEPGIAVQYLEIGTGGRKLGTNLGPITDQIHFRNTITQLRPDLVHVNPSLDPQMRSFVRDGLFIRRAKKKGLKVLVFFRGWNTEIEPVVERCWFWFFRGTYLHADAFIVLASRFKDKLRSWGAKGNIFLETTAVPENLINGYSQAARSLAPPSDEVKVLFLARLEWEKGIRETIEAFSRLRARGMPICLTIAGDGPAMDFVKRFKEENHAVGAALSIAGYVRNDAKRELLTSHDIYCFPSYYMEGMPNSLLEAMAFGLSVVTTDVGGVGDFFQDDRMGIKVTPRSVESVANALEQLISDRVRLREMGSFNQEYASRRFLAGHVASRLHGIYLETMTHSNTR